MDCLHCLGNIQFGAKDCLGNIEFGAKNCLGNMEFGVKDCLGNLEFISSLDLGILRLYGESLNPLPDKQHFMPLHFDVFGCIESNTFAILVRFLYFV